MIHTNSEEMITSGEGEKRKGNGILATSVVLCLLKKGDMKQTWQNINIFNFVGRVSYFLKK